MCMENAGTILEQKKTRTIKYSRINRRVLAGVTGINQESRSIGVGDVKQYADSAADKRHKVNERSQPPAGAMVYRASWKENDSWRINCGQFCRWRRCIYRY